MPSKQKDKTSESNRTYTVNPNEHLHPSYPVLRKTRRPPEIPRQRGISARIHPIQTQMVRQGMGHDQHDRVWKELQVYIINPSTGTPQVHP